MSFISAHPVRATPDFILLTVWSSDELSGCYWSWGGTRGGSGGSGGSIEPPKVKQTQTF